MVLVTNTSTSNVDNLMGTHIQTCDSNNGEDNWNLHQLETTEASDILKIPKLLENDVSKTKSQGMENGAHVTPSLTATQQAVVLAYCLLIEKSSRHDELQRRLPKFYTFIHDIMSSVCILGIHESPF